MNHPEREPTQQESVHKEVLTFEELRNALKRCMAANAATGAELRLHPDASRMADLFGTMIDQRVDSVPMVAVDAGILDAYMKWR